MTKQITITIGQGVDRDGKSLSYRLPDLKREALVLTAKVLGGYTATESRGGWIDPRGNLIEENSLVITSIVPEESVNAVKTLAKLLGEIFNQEQVMVVVSTVESEFIEIIPDSKVA